MAGVEDHAGYVYDVFTSFVAVTALFSAIYYRAADLLFTSGIVVALLSMRHGIVQHANRH